jgi:penicillin-binding protein 1B
MAESIDPQSGQLATPACPQTVTEYFVSGSEPTQFCGLHGGHLAQAPGTWLSHLFGKNGDPPPPAANSAAQPSNAANPAEQAPPADAEKKKGFLGKVFGIFGQSKKPADNTKPQP